MSTFRSPNLLIRNIYDVHIERDINQIQMIGNRQMIPIPGKMYGWFKEEITPQTRRRVFDLEDIRNERGAIYVTDDRYIGGICITNIDIDYDDESVTYWFDVCYSE